MSKKTLLISISIIGVLVLAGCSKKLINQQSSDNQATDISASQNKDDNNTSIANTDISADKLQVYYFCRTQRCYSCLTIGKYIKETIEDNFADEIQNGTIDFQEINIELSENREVAEKFKASGSSLFINTIRNSQDDISQDTNVWRLVGNENQFESYLVDKLNFLLGK